MTIDGEDRAPQDAPGAPGPPGLEALVQSMVEQAFAKQASELSERMALLESRDREAKAETKSEEEGDDGVGRVRFADVEAGEAGDGKKLTVVQALDDDGGDRTGLAGRMSLLERRLDAYDDGKEAATADDDDNKYTLGESTFSLLVTEHPCSVPFAFAACSVALSVVCLSLTLASSIMKGAKGNRIGIPGGVSDLVRASQFFGALVGEEIRGAASSGLFSSASQSNQIPSNKFLRRFFLQV